MLLRNVLPRVKASTLGNFLSNQGLYKGLPSALQRLIDDCLAGVVQ